MVSRTHFGRAFYALSRTLSLSAVTSLTRVRHFNVPDITSLRGLLIASNHQSYFDPVFIGIAFERPIHYLAREGLFRVPGFGWLLRAVGTHPVKQGKVDASAIKTVLSLLRGGEALVVFPEGTRTRDGQIGEFQRGAVSMAARCGVPLLPACIEGAFECWPRTRMLPRPGRVAVCFGEMLWPVAGAEDALTDTLKEKMRQMQGFLRRYLGRRLP